MFDDLIWLNFIGPKPYRSIGINQIHATNFKGISLIFLLYNAKQVVNNDINLIINYPRKSTDNLALVLGQKKYMYSWARNIPLA